MASFVHRFVAESNTRDAGIDRPHAGVLAHHGHPVRRASSIRGVVLCRGGSGYPSAMEAKIENRGGSKKGVARPLRFRRTVHRGLDEHRSIRAL